MQSFCQPANDLLITRSQEFLVALSVVRASHTYRSTYYEFVFVVVVVDSEETGCHVELDFMLDFLSCWFQ